MAKYINPIKKILSGEKTKPNITSTKKESPAKKKHDSSAKYIGAYSLLYEYSYA